MKLKEIVIARGALQKLIEQDLPLRQAFALVKLTDRINVHLDFYGRELWKIGDDEEKIRELEDFEVDDLPETRLQISMEGNVRLSGQDVKALEPFIEFVDEAYT